MPEKADLHIHTTCSDGKLSPLEAVAMAAEAKLKALAITDHDTFEGYKTARNAAEQQGIELIPGMEITTVFEGSERHLLAYYFDSESEKLAQFVLKQRVMRRNRIKKIIRILQTEGLEVDYEEVRAVANGANIGRPHLAKVLIDKGYAANIRDAFERYLSYTKLGEIETTYPDIREAVELIQNAGGAAVIAHPGRQYTADDIDKLVAYGIDGIECVHPSHKWEQQLKYTDYCDDNALLKTGGSDYHGTLGGWQAQVGVVTIAYKNVEKMKRMTTQRKNLLTSKY